MAARVEISGHPGLLNWLLNGETGRSSMTLVAQLTGHPRQQWWRRSEPADPSDFRRCELLLRKVPTLRPHLGLMADVSPAWRALVSRWDEIVTVAEAEVPGLFDVERPRGQAPKTYVLIQSCRGIS